MTEVKKTVKKRTSSRTPKIYDDVCIDRNEDIFIFHIRKKTGNLYGIRNIKEDKIIVPAKQSLSNLLVKYEKTKTISFILGDDEDED